MKSAGSILSIFLTLNTWLPVHGLEKGMRRGAHFKIRTISSADPVGDEDVNASDLPRFEVPLAADPSRTCTGYWLVGCAFVKAHHQWQERSPDGGPRYYYNDYVSAEDRQPLTKEVCWNFCKQVAGASYFGLEGGDKCFCAPWVAGLGTRALSDCDRVCPGSADEFCGGDGLATTYQMHDCKNLPPTPCTLPPPPVEHAKTWISPAYNGQPIPCKNLVRNVADSVNNRECEIECEQGYQELTNYVVCTRQGDPLKYTWGEFQGRAACAPIECGVPAEIDYALVNFSSEIFYPDTAHYACLYGYTLTGQPSGTKGFNIQCNYTGLFTGYQKCLPVECGDPPQDRNATADKTGMIVYLEHVTYTCDEGYSINTDVFGIKTYNRKCTANGEFSVGLRCQGISCGNIPSYGHTTLISMPPSTDVFQYPNKLNYKCGFGFTLDQKPVRSDNIAFAVKCQPDATTAYINGTLVSIPCKPISCGTPWPVKNAKSASNETVFGGIVKYSCEDGYTTDGKARGPNEFKVECGADGKFEVPESGSCNPVSCGEAPPVPKAKVTHTCGTGSCTYTGKVKYECLPGYSLNPDDRPKMRRQAGFDSKCQASGKFTPPPKCYNINNCFEKTCGGHGKCVDHEDPTGDPVKDWHCECDPGYEQLINASTGDKTCSDINDCPTKESFAYQCSGGGECIDLNVSLYTCNCSAGYQQVELKDSASNSTCVPMSCGHLPEAPHATKVVVSWPRADELYTKTTLKPSHVIFFTQPATAYTCDTGYTLDGNATGATKFFVKCELIGLSVTMTQLPTCKPVSCGAPKMIDHAITSRHLATMYYDKDPEKRTLKYTCAPGYTTDAEYGRFIPSAGFEVTCDADGSTPGYKTCVAVTCGFPPNVEDASTPLADEKIFYPQLIEYKCNLGYSTDGTSHPIRSKFNVSCPVNGQLTEPKKCIPIVCGKLPGVAHGSCPMVGQTLHYPMSTTYTADNGYSLDGKADGSKSFSVQCHPNSSFSEMTHILPFKPVECGLPPQVKHAQYIKTPKVFNQSIQYTCLAGYTLDAMPASGANAGFSCTCQANGSYSATQECKVVICSDIPTPSNAMLSPPDQGTIVYMKAAVFQCNTGYKLAGGAQSFSVPCMENGRFSTPPPCLNIDDCEVPYSSICGEGGHGTCKDKPVPTGKHIDDYECVCESGFTPKIKNTSLGEQRYCQNIDDCPKGACDPGTCEDLINDYKCHCPTGYHAEGGACKKQQCGSPPSVEKAKANSTAELFFKDVVEYTCLSGYTLDAEVDGDNTFTVQCGATHGSRAEGTLSGEYLIKRCKPVKCGSPPPIANANRTSNSRSSDQIMVFGDLITYTCAPGYSKDRKCHTDGSGTTFQKECIADGTFQFVEEEATCKSVLAGTPTPDHADVRTGPMYFPEVRTVVCDEGYSIDGKHSSFDNYNITAQADCSIDWPQNCTIIECGQAPVVLHATHQSGDAVLTYQQVITYTGDAGYTLDGKADGPNVAKMVCSSSGSFERTYGEDPATTSHGAPAGLNASAELPFKPVNCGPPPHVKHATYNPSDRTFDQLTTYSCDVGYATDAKPVPADTASSNFAVVCMQTGKFSPPKECKPVFCGKGPTILSASIITDVDFHYKDKAEYKCKPGYSLDGKLDGETMFSLDCLATGSFSEKAVCRNMNDCEGSLCGGHGKCVDLPNPTGVHYDDYTCDCDSGYKMVNITEADGTKYHTCGNINDCPSGACLPGYCKDLVNDYSCICPAGYHEAPNKAESLKHDCMKDSCDKPPTVPHATSQQSSTELFFGDVAHFVCEDGYTLDGSASGNKSFSLTCSLTGKTGGKAVAFTTAPTCEPVQCSIPPKLEYARPSTIVALVFKEVVTYTCIEGYSHLPHPDGCTSQSQFTLKCGADGDFVNKDGGNSSSTTCKALSAGTPTAQQIPNANFVEHEMFYPETELVTCKPGFSINPKDPTNKTFTLKTSPKCTFEPHPACVPVICGKPLAVGNATADQAGVEITFPGKVTYTTAKGYSVDGTVLGLKTFTTECKADGNLTSIQKYLPILPISCGIPKQTSCASRPDEELTYMQTVTYTCNVGCSTDGTGTADSKGNDKFQATCLDTGEFEYTGQCEFVKCTELPTHKNIEVTAAYFTTLNGDCFGNNLQTISDTSIDACSHTCLEDSACAGYSWLGERSQCVLKSQDCNQTAADGWTFYKKADKSNYNSTINFLCKPGYSLDGTVDGKTSFSQRCKASGKFSEAVGQECVNMNDCVPESVCDPHGTCKDNPVPTGVHLWDYTCECDSGFFERNTSNGRFCENKDDCPADACKVPASNGSQVTMIGTCEDLVDDYRCHCPLGSYPSADKHGCKKQSCGALPVIDHATTENGTSPEQFYNSTYRYKCDPGYSLNGSPDDDGIFYVGCDGVPGDGAEGNRTGLAACVPVSCGDTPSIPHGTTNASAFVYPNVINYTCDPGYSTRGLCDSSSKRGFSMACDKDGNYTFLDASHVECLPNFAGVPEVPNALFIAANMSYPDTLEVTCLEGFSIDTADITAKTFVLETSIDCDFEPRPSCSPILCPNPPYVLHAESSGSEQFGHKLEYKCHPGYSLDGKASQKACIDISGMYSTTSKNKTKRGPGENTLSQKGCSGTSEKDGWSYKVTGSSLSIDGVTDVTGTIAGAPGSHTIYWSNGETYTQQALTQVHYIRLDGMHCTGTDADVLRDFEGTNEECEAKCTEMNCIGFVRVHFGSGIGHGGKCYFRGGTLNDPVLTDSDGIRSCFIPSVPYKKAAGLHCTGTEADVLRDFEGTEKQCQAKCTRLNCVGFVRVHGGSSHGHNGKCYFRGGTLNAPYKTDTDDRDCFIPSVPIANVPPTISRNGGTQMMNWSLCNVPVHSNLGGKGPSQKEPKELRFTEVGTKGGIPIDLVVTTIGDTYTPNPKKDTWNGRNGCMGIINLKAGTHSKFEFKFVEHGTDELIDMTGSKHHFTIFDLDQGRRNKARESVVFRGASAYRVDPQTKLEIIGDVETGLKVSSTVTGYGHDNPRSEISLTDFQKQVAIEVVYEGVSKFEIELRVGEGGTGRNFLFAGTSVLVAEQPISVQDANSTTTMTTLAPTTPAPTLPDANSTTTMTTLAPTTPAPTLPVIEEHNIFEIACQADGTFEEPKECKRIECGATPTIDSATVEGAKDMMYFEDVVTYKCDTGYTLDGTASGGKEFNMTCNEIGEFSGLEICSPVVCSNLSHTKSNATLVPPEEKVVFGSVLTYGCNVGYTTTGKPAKSTEDTQFEATCKADGTISATGSCIDTNYCVTGEGHCGSGGKCVDGLLNYTCNCSGGYRPEMRKAPTTTSTATPATTTGEPSEKKEVQVRYEKAIRYKKAVGMHCTGTEADVLRDFEGTEEECQAKCTELNCIGFVRVHSGSSVGHNGKCYFRGGTLSAPFKTSSDSRDCFIPEPYEKKVVVVQVRYEKAAGMHCTGTEADVLRDFEGTEEECQAKCTELNCVGFVRVHSGSSVGHNGKCYFRGGTLSAPFKTSSDSRDCFIPITSAPTTTSTAAPTPTAADEESGGGELKMICVDTDECAPEAMNGTNYCSPGTCKDGVDSFTCECPAGYESKKLDINPKGQICIKKVCESVPAVAHADQSYPADKPCDYLTRIEYTCDLGYTLNGKSLGEHTFMLGCEADTTFKLVDSSGSVIGGDKIPTCKPVACPALPTVDNTVEVQRDLMTYGSPSASYKCKTGFTTTGSANGPSNFSVECLATGELTAPHSCLRVECGHAPQIPEATFKPVDPALMYYEDVKTYTCQEGYTITGVATDKNTFKVTCEVNGSTTGAEACAPVQCGAPPVFSNASADTVEKTYGTPHMVECDEGYSVNGTMEGQMNFVLMCLKDGSYSTHAGCMPVTCGVPEPLINAEPVTAKAIHYKEIVQYKCKDKYSMNGLPDGEIEFTRTCESKGEVEGPTTCKDIDFCLDNPCGRGVCSDCTLSPQTCKVKKGTFLQSIVGQPSAHNGDYNCACPTGYETVFVDGKLTCSEDDCHGDPCGPGGICTDLSGEKEATPNAYSCRCKQGYEVTEVNGSTTCVPVMCEPAPLMLNHATFTHKKGPLDRSSHPPGAVIYKDKIRYQCGIGYSTDPTCDSKRRFTVVCASGGYLEELWYGTASLPKCLPVSCGVRPDVELAIAPAMRGVVSYNSKAIEYDCVEGHQLASGQAKFSIACQADGSFSKASVCKPKVCGKVPVVEHARASACLNRKVAYPNYVVFTCDAGYYTSSNKTSFKVTCLESGQFSTVEKCFAKECEPGFMYGTSRHQRCAVGTTVDGTLEGANEFLEQCTLNGAITGTVKCLPVVLDLNGEILDATNDDPLKDAEVTLGSIDYVAPSQKSFLLTDYQTYCGLSSDITTEAACKAAAAELGLGYGRSTNKPRSHRYCFYDGIEVFFNGASDPAVVPDASCASLCYKGPGMMTKFRILPSVQTGEMGGSWMISRLEAYYTNDCSGSLVEAKSVFASSGSDKAEKAFDSDSSTAWKASCTNCEAEQEFIGFETSKPTVVRCMKILQCSEKGCAPSLKVQGQALGSSAWVNLVLSVDTQGAGLFTEIKEIPAILSQIQTAWNGEYKLSVSSGHFRVVGSKAGFISSIKDVTVNSENARGPRNVNLPLSPSMQPDEWRFVLEWNKHSRDLDMWMFFGPGTACAAGGTRERVKNHCTGCWVYYSSMHRDPYNCAGSQLEIWLENDDTSGLGPETMRIKGMGDCRPNSRDDCKVIFLVDNYSESDKALGDSGGQVTISSGNRERGKVDIPKSAGNDRWVPMLVIDAAKSQYKLFEASDYSR